MTVFKVLGVAKKVCLIASGSGQVTVREALMAVGLNSDQVTVMDENAELLEGNVMIDADETLWVLPFAVDLERKNDDEEFENETGDDNPTASATD